MKKCEVCATTILFGPVRNGERVYCSYECRESAQFEEDTAIIPDQAATAMAMEFNIGDCPKCGGPGPVDVQYSHMIWSALVVTSIRSNPEVSCVSCGRKAKLRALLFSFCFGWWGIPLGIIFTPVQIARNLYGMFSGPVHGDPSPDLQLITKQILADAEKRRSNHVEAQTNAT